MVRAEGFGVGRIGETVAGRSSATIRRGRAERVISLQRWFSPARGPGMKKAADILGGGGDTEPLRQNITGISKQLAKRIEGIELVRAARDEGKQEIAFNSRPFVLCGLPIKRPAAGVRDYSRVNGNFHLRITSNSPLGLPFGQDRLIPLWVSTLAIRQQNRIVTFDSAADLLREFGLTLGGTHYRRIVQGFERIFDATIFFGSEGTSGAARYVDRSRFNFFDRMRLWYLDDNPGLPGEDFQNVIVLSEQFWNEIQQHPIPVDLNMVRALAHAPGALDFACWLTWRCFTARMEQRIPLFGETGLISQLGVGNYARERRFREQVANWLKTVKQFWPDCPAALDEQVLTVRPGRAINASVRPRLRG
jgi:hypothetical protein